MRRLLGFVLHLSVLLIFLAAVVMPSCQGRHAEQRSSDRIPRASKWQRCSGTAITLKGILAKLREDPSFEGSDIGYMIVDCTDSLMQVIAQYEPTRHHDPGINPEAFRDRRCARDPRSFGLPRSDDHQPAQHQLAFVETAPQDRRRSLRDQQ